MREVLRLIECGDHHQALVRLWVLATTRQGSGDDLPLNAWERASRPAARGRQTATIRRALDDGRGIEPAAEVDPLALIVALDAFLGLETAPRGFASVTYRVDERDYWLVPLNLTRASAASSARQTGNPHAWFRHHRVVPARLASGLPVQPKPSRDVTDTRLRDVKAAGRLRAFLGHFADGARLTPEPAHRFFATGLSDEIARAAGVDQALARATQENADVALLPELTVTPAQRDAVKRRLGQAGGPALVVPGSFHEERNGEKVNVAELLGADGQTLLAHEKLRPFGEADGMAEDIRAAHALGLLVTPIGSIALVICKDYCDEPGPIRDWDALAVDWWLVPSMGDESTLSAHARRAQAQWTVINRAVTLVANQESGAEVPSAPRPGFVFDGTRRDVGAGGGCLDIPLTVPERPDLKALRGAKRL